MKLQTIDRIEADTQRYVGSVFNLVDTLQDTAPKQSHTMSALGCEYQIAQMYHDEKPYRLLEKLCIAQDMCEDYGFTLEAYHTYQKGLIR